MYNEEKDAAIRYGTYASANKEAEFINVDLAEQVQAGYMDVLPLEAVGLTASGRQSSYRLETAS